MNTLKQEVGGTKAEELQPLIEERSVSVKEGRDKLPMLYCYTGPSCSKLTMSLVNDSLKFTSIDTQIC